MKSIKQLLKEKLAEAKDARVRLQLSFHKLNTPDPEWISLPWEFLYSEERSEFLSTDFNLVLSRFLELDEDRVEFEPSAEPLRLLMVVSRPPNEGPVLAKDVLKHINGMSTGLVDDKEVTKANITVKILEQPNEQDLENNLRQFKPHVLHFIGHGRYDPQEKIGYLLLINTESNKALDFSTDRLLSTFNAAQCYPRLVFLHMCEGGISERDATTLQAFSGFAPRLVLAGIPTVVAMQYPIRNEPARDFSLAFYNTLASGGSVDEAVQEGRRKIDMERRSLLFGTPVLYMQSATGFVLVPPKPSDGAKILIETKGRSEAAPTAATVSPIPDQLPPAETTLVKSIIQTGREEVDQTLSGATRTKMYARMAKLESQLIGKSIDKVLAMLIELHDHEEDDQIKDVWFKMMGSMPLEF